MQIICHAGLVIRPESFIYCIVLMFYHVAGRTSGVGGGRVLYILYIGKEARFMTDVIIEIEIDGKTPKERKKEIEKTVVKLLNKIENFKICSIRWR